DDGDTQRKASDRPMVLSAALAVSPGEAARLHLMLDEVVAQRFFGTDLRPWWTQHFKNATLALAAAEEQAELRRSRAQDSDQKLMAELRSRGGEKYVQLGSLVYRQVTGATSTAWNHKAGEEWPFMKEISSDGDVSTVDVIFPAFPFFLHLAPEFFRKLMLPLLVYSVNGTAPYGMDIKYNLSWAPHHLGTWPVCALRGDQQEQMPVEESGNMLIMIAAVSKKLGNLEWLSSYWSLLKTWADFLVASLPDPGNQLCTDDFE
ncbi:gtaA, partial [Symbiodinium necroappetens]